MRERLIATLVGLTIVVIALYGVPRAYFVAADVRDRETEKVDAAATLLARMVADRERDGGRVDADLLEPALVAADGVTFVDAAGERVSVGSPVSDHGDESAIVVTRSLADGSRLTVSTSAGSVRSEIGGAIRPLVLLGLLLAAGAAVFAVVLARRESRPYRELAGAAERLGTGRFDLEIPRYRVAEADAIGTSLRDSAMQLEQLVRREREFAANASHQLRTPITALRLELEDITLRPETPAAVAEDLQRALGELDRLTAAIDDLLHLARGRRESDHVEVDLATLVAEAARRWRPQLESAGRRLVVDAPASVVARVPAGPVVQVLDVLVDNARVHGKGTVTLILREEPTHLSLTVADEGDARLTPAVFRRGVSARKSTGDSHGLGLAVATELAESVGGHLSFNRVTPTTSFVLWLPRPDAASRVSR